MNRDLKSIKLLEALNSSSKRITYNRFKYPVDFNDLYMPATRKDCYEVHGDKYEHSADYQNVIKEIMKKVFLKINEDYIYIEKKYVLTCGVATDKLLYLTIPAAIKVIDYLINIIPDVNFYENEKTKSLMLDFKQSLVDMMNEHLPENKPDIDYYRYKSIQDRILCDLESLANKRHGPWIEQYSKLAELLKDLNLMQELFNERNSTKD